MTSSAVRERPILFSGPMVRAILDGRKTQTRRVMRLPDGWESGWEPLLAADGSCDVKWMSSPVPGVIKMGRTKWLKCPYGAPGDHLWVREAWYDVGRWHGCFDEWDEYDSRWGSVLGPASNRRPFYAADGAVSDHTAGGLSVRKKPSIHMPRWASRLTLEIVSVRVERVQDISKEDAEAEGVECPRDPRCRGWIPNGVEGSIEPDMCLYCAAIGDVGMFRNLWDSINGKRDGCSWTANPWVWVIEFKLVQP